ncbi:MAG: phosphatidylserine decarboxylase family protein [Saprospiraceae bacterium]|nr:phosphatidylserine decarboxylase family protein [Saprospiraceae bacterium]
MFQIHPEGRKIILITCVLVFLLGILLGYLAPAWMRIIGAIILLTFLLLVVSFFRVPKRTLRVEDDGRIIAPADGKVVVIEEVEDTEFLQARCKQISIFMSPLNVHINWYPCNGQIVYKQHHEGKYLVAWHPKSSLENERTTTVIQRKEANILVRQIAGAVARRIINYSQPGDQAILGQQLGFIKFGSRVDILLPVTARVDVDLQQIVEGGVTVIATL